MSAAPKSGDPPIIKADNTPTKVMPAPADTATKTPDRMPSGDGTEKIVPREEKPVDVNANSGAPRVVFPPLDAERQSAAAGERRNRRAAACTAGRGADQRHLAEQRAAQDQDAVGSRRSGRCRPRAGCRRRPAGSRKAGQIRVRRAARRAAAAAAANAPLSLAPDAQASAPAPEPRRVATLQPPPGAPGS